MTGSGRERLSSPLTVGGNFLSATVIVSSNFLLTRVQLSLEAISNVAFTVGESRSPRDGRKLRRAIQGSDESFPRPYLKLRLSQKSAWVTRAENCAQLVR